MDAYFIAKLWIEIGLIAMTGIALLVFLVALAIEHKKYELKTNYLQSIGFSRHLRNVSSVGNKCWYDWRREITPLTSQHILEEDLHKMSLKELKNKYPL